MMQIRPATQNDIADILQVTKACDLYMRSKGILQWTENYPSREAFETDVSRGELFALLKDKTIIGCITISEIIDEVYKPVVWLTQTSKHKYVHRLAVHPHHQRKGYARHLMDFAENLALEDRCISVRLDTFSLNMGNQKFYESRGYQKLGEIFFPLQSKHPFYCYELVL
ncbi:GNAT family N-acetyltransferase [Flavobacteriaceae bacterium M23B6Z8]